MDAHTDTPASDRQTPMHINGKRVYGKREIEVRNPYTGEVVGTVPDADPSDVAAAFEAAAAYKPTLTRYERQQILTKTAELLVARKDEISDLITAESGLSKKDSLYEVGRAFDVFSSGRSVVHSRRRRNFFLRPDAARAAAAKSLRSENRCWV